MKGIYFGMHGIWWYTPAMHRVTQSFLLIKYDILFFHRMQMGFNTIDE